MLYHISLHFLHRTILGHNRNDIHNKTQTTSQIQHQQHTCIKMWGDMMLYNVYDTIINIAFPN